MAYKVVMRPEGRNPGPLRKAAGEVFGHSPDNVSGIVVLISDGNGHEEEVSRVAYIRRVSRNPSVDFKAQLKVERKKAEDAVEALNAMLSGAGELA